MLRRLELSSGVGAGALIAAATLLQPGVWPGAEVWFVAILLFRIGLPVLGAYLHAVRNQWLGLWLLWIRIAPWLLALLLIALATVLRLLQPSPDPASLIYPESDTPTLAGALDLAGEGAAVLAALSAALRYVVRPARLRQP